MLFYALAGAVHWSVFFVVILGLVWGVVGLLGQYDQKLQAVAGVVLNVVPLVLAVVLGLEAPWIERTEGIETQQIEQMTPEQRAQMRAQKRQEMMRQFQQMQRSAQ